MLPSVSVPVDELKVENAWSVSWVHAHIDRPRSDHCILLTRILYVRGKRCTDVSCGFSLIQSNLMSPDAATPFLRVNFMEVGSQLIITLESFPGLAD